MKIKTTLDKLISKIGKMHKIYQFPKKSNPN